MKQRSNIVKRANNDEVVREGDAVKRYFIETMCNKFKKVTGHTDADKLTKDAQKVYQKIEKQTATFSVGGSNSSDSSCGSSSDSDNTSSSGSESSDEDESQLFVEPINREAVPTGETSRCIDGSKPNFTVRLKHKNIVNVCIFFITAVILGLLFFL